MPPRSALNIVSDAQTSITASAQRILKQMLPHYKEHIIDLDKHN